LLSYGLSQLPPVILHEPVTETFVPSRLRTMSLVSQPLPWLIQCGNRSRL